MHKVKQLLKTKISILLGIAFLTYSGGILGEDTPTKEFVTNAAATIKKTYYTMQKIDKTTSLFLAKEIGDSLEYIDLLPVFLGLDKDDVVNVYLEGNGGSVDGAEMLAALFHSTKATVNVIVYGNVYSAHAALALQGSTLKILDPNIRFLFHVPALGDGRKVDTGLCKDVIGEDRGQSSKKKCETFVENTLDEYENTLAKNFLIIMSPAEYRAYLDGWDVIVKGSDITARLSA